MKKLPIIKSFLFFLAISLTMVSCDKEETIVTDDLDGEWNLTSVVCLCPPLSFDVGENVWKINTSENQLIVENNSVQETHTILDSGMYEITLTETTFEVEGITYDYQVDGDKLSLWHEPEVDGPVIQFIK